VPNEKTTRAITSPLVWPSSWFVATAFNALYFF